MKMSIVDTMVRDNMAKFFERMTELRRQVGQITLGELVALLKARPQDQEVRYDFAWMVPTKAASWRGSYDQLALGYANLSDRHNSEQVKEPTVAELVAHLESCVGKEFQGWKGGDYLMAADTVLWVANPGESCNTAITGVSGCDYMTIITTIYLEY